MGRVGKHKLGDNLGKWGDLVWKELPVERVVIDSFLSKGYESGCICAQSHLLYMLCINIKNNTCFDIKTKNKCALFQFRQTFIRIFLKQIKY